MGFMTGRGAGYCSGYSLPDGFRRPHGLGYSPGFGFRGGRGPYGGGTRFGDDCGAPFVGLTREQEKETRQQQAVVAEQTSKELQQRMAGIEDEQKKPQRWVNDKDQ
jgi:hypothetical protein